MYICVQQTLRKRKTMNLKGYKMRGQRHGKNERKKEYNNM